MISKKLLPQAGETSLDTQFIAVGTGGYATTSPDALSGGSWAAGGPGGGNLFSTAFGAGTYIVGGFNGGIWESPTGTGSWTQRVNTGAGIFEDMVFGNDLFAAVGHTNAPRLMVSADAINWTDLTSDIGATGLRGIGFGYVSEGVPEKPLF